MKILSEFIRWFDSEAPESSEHHPEAVRWVRVLPFVFLHALLLLLPWVGFSWFALSAAIVFYVMRAFFITGFYHRYFSHKSYQTHRLTQAVFAFLGGTAVQRGALWWAAHHRNHHSYSDTPQDPHSPKHLGFWRSHMLWFMTNKHFTTDYSRVPDFAKYPELRWLNRFDIVPPLCFAIFCYALGEYCALHFPKLATNGPQMLMYGFILSTLILFHVTACINSVCHVYGKKALQTKDDSRNNRLLALLAVGEGWHNNHHRYPYSVKQGLYWYQIDITYYILRLLAAFGLIWNFKYPCKEAPHEEKQASIQALS